MELVGLGERLRGLRRPERGVISHDRHRLVFPEGFWIQVNKKDILKGTTPYQFSHSFKGNIEGFPIQPEELKRIGEVLGEKIYKNEDTLLIAIDRGGTMLGNAVAQATGLPLHIAYSSNGDIPSNMVVWEEKGAGKNLAVPFLPPRSRVVLIDDIIDTGQTYAAAIKALREKGITVSQIVALAEVQKQGIMGRDVIYDEDPTVDIQTLHLIPQPIYDQNTHEYKFPFS